MITSPPVVAELGLRLARLGWVTELFVGGSVATGDYLPRISDLDLVALTDGPIDVLPAMNDDEVRAAARAELLGYWTWAARRPWLWLDPVIADLGLTSMARGLHTLATGSAMSGWPTAGEATTNAMSAREEPAGRNAGAFGSGIAPEAKRVGRARNRLRRIDQPKRPEM